MISGRAGRVQTLTGPVAPRAQLVDWCRDSLWASAERHSFEVVVYDRNAANREKKIDTQITADMIEDSCELMNADRDEITLVAGDKDYVPAIEKLRKRAFTVHVAARELKESATKFIALDPYLEHLRRK